MNISCNRGLYKGADLIEHSFIKIGKNWIMMTRYYCSFVGIESCRSHIQLLGQISNTSWVHQANYAKAKEEGENLLASCIVSTRKSRSLKSIQDRT